MPDDIAAGAAAESRRELLAAAVADNGFLRVAEASAELGVSAVTIRADLRVLEAAGRIRRVHGGAMAAPAPDRETPVEASAGNAAEAKRAIGRRAAGLVTSGSSILLDVGSTPLAVARALVARTELTGVTVITNGLAIALALEPAVPRLTVVVTGGTLRPLQHSLVDPLAGQTLAGLHADLAILGCTGIDDAGTITNVNLPEAQVKRAMLAAADRAVLIADSGKVGRRHLGAIGTLADVEAVVTDPLGADRLAAAARAAGTRLIVARPTAAAS